jgi:hypothetical protein
MNGDPYSILGVKPGTSQAEIRTAWLKWTRLMHPDRWDRAKNPHEWEWANLKLQEINAAYDVLKRGESVRQGPPPRSNTSPPKPSTPPPQSPPPPPDPAPQQERPEPATKAKPNPAISRWVLSVSILFVAGGGILAVQHHPWWGLLCAGIAFYAFEMAKEIDPSAKYAKLTVPEVIGHIAGVAIWVMILWEFGKFMMGSHAPHHVVEETPKAAVAPAAMEIADSVRRVESVLQPEPVRRAEPVSQTDSAVSQATPPPTRVSDPNLIPYTRDISVPAIALDSLKFEDAYGGFQNDSRNAAMGDRDAMFMLAYRYESGQNPPYYIPDLPRALAWYYKATQAGSVEAANNMGVMWYFGEGIQQDRRVAARWFSAAAKAGNAVAAKNLTYAERGGQ